MDKDLAGQDAKDLYDVSVQTCQSQRVLFLFKKFISPIFNKFLFHEKWELLEK